LTGKKPAAYKNTDENNSSAVRLPFCLVAKLTDADSRRRTANKSIDLFSLEP